MTVMAYKNTNRGRFFVSRNFVVLGQLLLKNISRMRRFPQVFVTTPLHRKEFYCRCIHCGFRHGFGEHLDINHINHFSNPESKFEQVTFAGKEKVRISKYKIFILNLLYLISILERNKHIDRPFFCFLEYALSQYIRTYLKCALRLALLSSIFVLKPFFRKVLFYLLLIKPQ